MIKMPDLNQGRNFDLSNSRMQLLRHYPYSNLDEWKNFGHCELISKDAEAYVEDIRKFLNVQ